MKKIFFAFSNVPLLWGLWFIVCLWCSCGPSTFRFATFRRVKIHHHFRYATTMMNFDLLCDSIKFWK